MIDNLKKMASGLQEMVKMLKDNPQDKDEIIEGITIAKEEMLNIFKMMECVITGEEHPHLNPILRVQLKATMEAEAAKPQDPVEIHNNIMLVLAMTIAADEDLGYPLVYPFMREVFKQGRKLVKLIDPEKAKVIKKAMKETHQGYKEEFK